MIFSLMKFDSIICVKKVFVYVSILLAFLFLNLFLILLSFRFRGCWRCLLKRKTKEKKLFFCQKKAKTVYIIYRFFLLFLTGLANQVELRMKMTWICLQSNQVSFSENIFKTDFVHLLKTVTFLKMHTIR